MSEPLDSDGSGSNPPRSVGNILLFPTSIPHTPINTMTEVTSFYRIRNGQEEFVREHLRGAPHFTGERSSTNIRRIHSSEAVLAARARLAAKGYPTTST